MFYRRKIILAILQIFGGRLEKINLYKLLLILTKRQEKPEYDFIPYKFGCYSFSLHADLVTMYKKELLFDEDIAVQKLDNKNYLSIVNDTDKKLIVALHEEFINSTVDELMYYTYTKYPYTAINSLKAKSLLSHIEFARVKNCISATDKIILFTIGYEGISLEEYLNRLIKNDVKVLVDVRNNPLSQKYGFSKNQLQGFCKSLNIEYLHFGEVGIESKHRQVLNNQNDYNTLFNSYKKETIPNTLTTQKKILNLLIEKQRIALTCFEANICQCHRKHLADAITNLPGWAFELKHI